MNQSYFNSYIELYNSDPFSTYVNETICALGRSCHTLISTYPIGCSVQGVPIRALNLGWGNTPILIQATHHARESITTILVLDQISYLLQLFKCDYCVDGISIRQLLQDITLVFVPLVNPDGADLVLNGASTVLDCYQDQPYLKKELFPSWKANIRGVDLNENYPTSYPSKVLTKEPGSQFYPGPKPFSEPETLALRCLTESYCFAGTISYHSSGEEIYWYYNQEQTTRDFMIANAIAKETGYSILPADGTSYGSGYKDWFIENYHRPALTIEVAPYAGDKKVPLKDYNDLWEKNKNVPILFASKILCI